MDQPEAPSEGGGHTLEGALLDGRYRVASALGAGGMATVYLAQDERLDRSVVVKTPHPALAVEKDFRARFDREIRNLTKIEHPHVLKVHDTGSFRDLPYAVMQHLSGGSLADRLRAAGGRQPAQVVLPWLLQVADALDHIHSRGFVHRDIKPGNILYDDAGNVVVADFGIAKAMGHLDTGITATGVTPGSPGYMAPEVLKGGELGPAYDQYSLAVCVYEALCGQLPYPGETPLELLAGLMSRSAADLSPLVPEIPPDATAAVMRALARDPANRFATCTEFAKSFQTALGVPTMQVFPEQFRTALRRKRWMRAGMAAASLGVAAALGAGAVSLLRGDAPPSFPPDAPRAGTAPSAPSAPSTPSAPSADVPTWELVTPEGAPPDVKVSPLQIETAKRLGLRVWFENELGMRFVLIPPGRFTTGSPESEIGRIASEKQREVLIDAPYYMQTTELTNGQMRRVVPEHANPQWSGADTNADDLPAGSLTKAKVDALTRQMSRRAGRAYAAPTSLQWEYACRAGTTTSRFWGDDEQGAARFVNIADQSAAERWPHWRVAPVRDGHAGPAPAGSMDANPWGLREILGNVAEFAVGSDGAGEWRGGCWPAAMECCRAAATFDPTGADPLLGLRLVAPVSFQDRGPTPWPLTRPEGAPPDVLVSQFQIDEAAKLGVPVWFENSLGMKFVLIPAGRFLMGSPPDEPGRGADETQHPVTLTRPFYISVTETTCAQYGAWDATHRCGTLYDVLQLDGPSLPVTRISASEIRAYSEWLATKDPGRAYRLPTDAEWERACRAGSPEAHPWGADVAESVKHANVPDASFRARLPKSFTLTDADDGHASSSPAGSFLPNRWGLYDMIGNALEFTSDAHKPHDAAPAVDPASPATGPTGHSLRGGGMGSSVSLLRAASRVAARSERGEDTGFRLVCDIPTK